MTSGFLWYFCFSIALGVFIEIQKNVAEAKGKLSSKSPYPEDDTIFIVAFFLAICWPAILGMILVEMSEWISKASKKA